MAQDRLGRSYGVHRALLGGALVAGLVIAAIPSSAQILSQSELTREDVDPSFRLTVDHLAEDLRWLGVPPRDITWSPDGRHIYFRWREDPDPEQHPDTDPWYAIDPDGRDARRVDEDEAVEIPDDDIVWSLDRETAAWARDGTLFLWTEDGGTRAVFTAERTPGNLRIAPDGSRVHFSTRGLSRFSDESGDLWEYQVERGKARQIARVTRKAEEPKGEVTRWLRDQQHELIETVRQRERNRQIADSVRRSRALESPQAIPIERGARAFDLQLTPDGRHLTFLWEKEPPDEPGTHYMDFVNDSGYAIAREARPKVGEPLSSYKMGIVRVDPTVDPDSVEITWVEDGTDKETIIHGPYWSPTGDRAAVQILSMDHKERWIGFLDIESGAVSTVHHRKVEEWIGGPLIRGRWSPGWLQWLPDGSAFGFVSEATGWAMLYLASRDGEVRRLTDGEWEVRAAELSPDGRTWFLTTSAEHPGEEHLYHLPARGGDLRRVTMGEGMHRAWPSPDGRRLAVTYEAPNVIRDLYVMDNRPGAEKRRVTKSGTEEYYRHAWAESEILRFDDPAGEPTWAEVWAPPERPSGAAVVYVHGCGECAQGVTKGWRRVRATLYANYLRQNGYLAANLDYRGSWGYGYANRTYAYRQMGVSDVDSGLPFLEILAERYGADPRRIGIYGGSYGGFYTLMSLFRHPGKYAAGVSLYPVTDWAHYNHGYTSRILNGAPFEDEEAYRASSPVYYADDLADALQIQHGLVDGNVQIQDSFRLAQMLIEKAKDFDLVVYPVEDHGWDEVSSRRDSYRRMTRWFDRHLLGSETAATR